ncbi:hypothetical protein NZK32_08695 [Cyanobium sp. FGCU-52]|nr:hypothetical protein [Cyanobium sp. FGCU52]
MCFLINLLEGEPYTAKPGLARVRWNERIPEELITAVLRNQPDRSRQQLEHIRAWRNAHCAMRS